MHQPGEPKVTGRERLSNLLQVRPDRCRPRTIRFVPLQNNPAAIHQRFEAMRGRVLVDAHGELPPCLYPSKCRILPSSSPMHCRWLGAAGYRCKANERDEDESTLHGPASTISCKRPERTHALERDTAAGSPAAGKSRSAVCRNASTNARSVSSPLIRSSRLSPQAACDRCATS